MFTEGDTHSVEAPRALIVIAVAECTHGVGVENVLPGAEPGINQIILTPSIPVRYVTWPFVHVGFEVLRDAT